MLVALSRGWLISEATHRDHARRMYCLSTHPFSVASAAMVWDWKNQHIPGWDVTQRYLK